jgi:hypothetical protein
MRRIIVLVSISSLMLAQACKKPTGKPGPKPLSNEERAKSIDGPRRTGTGRALLSGAVSDLMVSADGHLLSAIVDGVKPNVEGTPPAMRVGEVVLHNLTWPDSQPVRVGKGVFNAPGGRLFSKDGRWFLFLEDYSLPKQSGALKVVKTDEPKGTPIAVASGVTYYVPSLDGRLLAFVANGVLKVGPLPGGPFREIAGEVSTAQFSEDGATLYFRRRIAAAGGLFQVSLAQAQPVPKKVTDLVGDFELAPGGKSVAFLSRSSPQASTMSLFVSDTETLKPTLLAERVLRFSFSPDGQWIAAMQGDSPEHPGDLWLGKTGGGEGSVLGKDVRDYAFSSDSKRLAFRQKFREVQLRGVQTERLGELYTLALPNLTPKLIAKDCPNFLFSPDGQALAYTATVFQPDYTRKLMLLPAGATEPKLLQEWLYEYNFAPDSSRLYFRAKCMREGRSCDLLSVDAVKPELPAKKEATQVYRFGLSRDGQRLWTSYVHALDQSQDLFVVNVKTGVKTLIDQYVMPPYELTSNDGSSVGYVVEEKSRPGLFWANQIP